MAKANLIRLNNERGTDVTLFDIVENPKSLKIKEIDAAQLPRSLADLDIAIINSNYAIPAHLYPSRDSLFLEGTDSNYANLVVTQTQKLHDFRLQKLMQALQSEEVLQKANQLFRREAIPAWE